MVLDLDNFKMANDIYGHKKGDEVLCKVSDILRENFRDGDCVARLGGDEFIVFLPEIGQKDSVVERVQKLLDNFPIVIEGERRVEVSVSIGIAYRNPGENIEYEVLCSKADEAMYRAKKLGKGKAVISEEKNARELVIVA
jgi:putative two-component system response regulator